MTRTTLSSSLIVLAATTLASAQSVDGGASWSGWTSGGNSLDLGNYVRGSGVFDFNMYTTAFSISSGSPLLGTGWQAGDSVLAIGGAINQGAVNTNLSQSVRLVTKFGTDTNTFSASTVVPTSGNGNGSFSGGAGGDGAILLGTDGPTQGPGNLNPTTVGSYTSIFVGPGAPGPGVVYTMPLSQRYDTGIVDSGITTDIGKFVFLFDSNNVLSSWQIFLNRSLLADVLPSGEELPNIGNQAIMTLQRSTSSTLLTDSMVTVVPTPASAALLGFAGIAAARRRR